MTPVTNAPIHRHIPPHDNSPTMHSRLLCKDPKTNKNSFNLPKINLSSRYKQCALWPEVYSQLGSVVSKRGTDNKLTSLLVDKIGLGNDLVKTCFCSFSSSGINFTKKIPCLGIHIELEECKKSKFLTAIYFCWRQLKYFVKF